MRAQLVFLAYLVCIGFLPWSGARSRDGRKDLRLPEIPDSLTTSEDRTAYLSLHYWDNFDFADTALISRPEITEQAFVDFISILPYTDRAAAAVDTLFRRALSRRDMFYHFISLADKYLYESYSPMRNDDLYILVLQALVENPLLEEADKARPKYLLDMAQKNRPGNAAADFEVLCRDGERLMMSEIEAENLLVFFNDPDCSDCRRVKDRLASSLVVSEMMSSGRLKILSVCVEGSSSAWEMASFPSVWIDGCDDGKRLVLDGLYDLKVMPVLYLLDSEKRVLLKDVSVDDIETWLLQLTK